MESLLVLGLGVGAGLLTTLAGMGGGLCLLLALSLLWDPRLALSATALPLLLGNLHRAALFREDLSWRHAGWFASGAAPAALLAGVWLVAIPEGWIRAIMLAMTLLAIAKTTGRWRHAISAPTLLPGGAAIGSLTAASGGAGILTAPLLMASGLEGAAYVGTASVAAATMHLSRLAGYGAAGLVTRASLAAAGVIAVGIVVGNALGRRGRAHLDERHVARLQLAVLVGCTGLAVAGMT